MAQHFLDDFQRFCNNEDEFYRLIESDRYEHNFHRLMKGFQKQKEDPFILERYRANIDEARKLVDTLEIVHNTDFEALVSIYTEGRLLSANRLLVTDFDFHQRYPSGGHVFKMMDYVICGISPGSLLSGLYEIHFNRELEEKITGYFIPHSHVCYDKCRVEDNMMEIRHWREYMIEAIAINAKDVSAFWNRMHPSEKPDLIFPNFIDISFIKEIYCASRRAYYELMDNSFMLFNYRKQTPPISYGTQ